MPYNPFSVPNRVHKLPHAVVTECSNMHCNKSCIFYFIFLHCTLFEYDKFRTWFNFEVQHPRCVYQYNLRYIRVVKTQLKIYLQHSGLKKKQLHVSALVMAIIRLCNTYCKITIQYAKQQYGLITRSQSPLQIYRSNLVYVIMYLVGKVQAVEGVRSTSHTYDYVCAVLHMRICNYIHYYIADVLKLTIKCIILIYVSLLLHVGPNRKNTQIVELCMC